MTFDRKITLLSVGVAVAATLAASVQSFVSWRGRNDPLRSTILGEIAKDCHDIALDAGNAISRPKTIDYFREMNAKAAALDLLIDALEATDKRSISEEMRKFLEKDFDKAANEAGFGAPTSGNPTQQGIEVEFLFHLNATCVDAIKKEI